MVAENSFRNLSHSDLQLVMLVCEQLHRADPGQSFLRHSRNVMNPVFGHVHHSHEIYRMNPFALIELENPTVESHMIDVFNRHVTDHPFVPLMLSDKPHHLETHQQLPDLAHFKQSDLYNEFYVKVKGQNHLWFAHRAGNKLLSCVFLRENEFSERELAMAHLIHPHLGTAWKNWKNTRKLKEELGALKQAIFQSKEEEAAAALLRKALDALSQRQCDVVECVAAGLDNQQIADELKVSVLTVKKHLQAIFQLLEVHHRTALAAIWHQAHSISIY